MRKEELTTERGRKEGGYSIERGEREEKYNEKKGINNR